MINKMKKIIIALSIVGLLGGCATNPITGRKQLNTVSEEQLFPQSFAAYKETLAKSQLSNDGYKNAQVTRVGKRIQAAVEKFFRETNNPGALKNYQWEYKVIESDELNAWCMPGGKVAFYTGILPVCKDDTGIAVVMGHEIAHAIANHGGERMSQGQLLGTVGQVGGILLGNSGASAVTQQGILQAYGIGSQVGILNYSRKHESEADEMGILFMALAGYDPTEAPAFWERMEQMTQASSDGKERVPEFMSTHPHPQTRINDLNKLMEVAKAVYQARSIAPYFEYKKRK